MPISHKLNCERALDHSDGAGRVKRAVIQKKSIKEVSGVVRGREKRQGEGCHESQSLRKLSKGGVVHGPCWV